MSKSSDNFGLDINEGDSNGVPVYLICHYTMVPDTSPLDCTRFETLLRKPWDLYGSLTISWNLTNPMVFLAKFQTWCNQGGSY